MDVRGAAGALEPGALGAGARDAVALDDGGLLTGAGPGAAASGGR